MVNARTISMLIMSILAVALLITLLVFWFMDKPLHLKEVENRNNDTQTAIDETELLAKFAQVYRAEAKKLNEQNSK